MPDYDPNSVQIFDLPPAEGQSTEPLFPAPADQTGVNLKSDDQTKMTSTLATFADQMNGIADQNFESTQAIYENRIKIGQEKELRSKIADDQRQREIDGLQALQRAALTTNPNDYALGDAFHAEQAALAAPKNDSALEQDGTQIMQASQPTPQGSALSAYLGGARQEQAGYAAKVAIFNSKLDDLAGKSAAENPLYQAGDFLFDQSGLRDFIIDGHFNKSVGSFFNLPSTNLNDQKAALWGLSPQEFGQAIDHAASRMTPHQAYEALKALGGNEIGTGSQSAVGYNFWTLLGPVSYLPVIKMAKYASGLARVVGNRGLSTNLVTSGIMAASSGLKSGMEHVQPIEATIAETLPSVSVPDTLALARGDVGVVSDVADRLEAMQRAGDAVRATLAKTPRLEPPQIREALEKALKDAELTYRDSPVADIKREVVAPDVTETTETPKPFVIHAPVNTLERMATPLKNYLHNEGYERFTADQADQIIGDHLHPEDFGSETRFTREEADRITRPIYLDEFDVDHLAALNEQGELRQGKLIREAGKTRFEIDNDSDIDSLSHWNARGEIYPVDQAKETFRENPFEVAFRDHVFLDNGIKPLKSEDADIAAGKGFKFTVALKEPNGHVRVGKPGMIHSELLHGDEEPTDALSAGMGFVDQNGKFYTRKEAAQAIGRPGSDPEGLSSGFNNLISKLSDKTPEGGAVGGIRSIPEVVKSPSTGLYSLKFYVGKDQTAGGFLTQEGAVAAAQRHGLADPRVIQTLDGHWYIEATHVVPESGLVTKAVLPSDYPTYVKASEFVKSLDGLQTMLHNEVRKGAVMSQGRYLAKVVGPYAKAIKKLNGRQTRLLSSVLRAGEAEHTWYSMQELYDKYNQLAGRMPSEKEATAYYSAKELSDLNYHIHNDRLYVARVRRGLQDVRIKNPELGFDTGTLAGRTVPPDVAKGQRIFVNEDGSVEDGIRKDTQVLLDTGHYKMVELDTAMFKEGKPVKYILTHQDSLETSPLSRKQLEYNPGGSREYANKFFVKQANPFDTEGHRTWLDPLTHVTGPTKKSLKSWTEGMNEALSILNNDKLSDAEKRLLIEKTPIQDLDKLTKMVAEGKIHPKTPFEIVFDKQDPEAQVIRDGDTNWTNPAIRGEESYYQTQARLVYGQKGERLREPDGNLAQTVNPLTTLRRSVYNAARTNALGDYNTKVIEDWARAAQSLLDHRSVSNDPDPWEVFFNGQFLKRGLSPENQRLAASMDISRNAHKRFMGMRDLDLTTKTMYMKQLAEALESKGYLGEKVATAIYSRLNSDPVGFAKELVFHSYFGFGNLRRFVLHASQAIGSIAVDPVRGLSAAGMAPITAALVHINRSDAVLDYMSRKMGTELGMGVNDYKQMVQSLRYSGWLNVGGEVAQLDRYADRWGGTILTKGWDTVKHYGILPFHAAIGLQRLMAYHIAWGMAKELMPEADVFENQFQRWVNNKADALSGNMTSASSAAWQKGVWGVPTQFMSWQARMMENILPETFGGSKALSGQQKLAYALGQTLMWGAGGLPALGAGYDIISDLYTQNNGKQIDADTHRAITKGLVDSMIHHFTGSDTNLSGEAGFGSALNRTLTGFYNGQMSPFLSFIGGPVTATGNQLVDTVSQMATYVKAEQSDSLSSVEFKMALQDALPFIQAFKFDQKAYWAWKYHALYDPKTGQPIIDDATTSDAVVAGLGIPNVWETVKAPFYQTLEDQEKAVDDVAKQVVKLRRQELSAIRDDDQDTMKQTENVVRVLMQPWRDRPLMQQKIAQRATQLMTGGYTETEKQQLIQRSIKQTGLPPAEATESTE